MATKWIKVENDVINPDFVALVERNGNQVAVHLALPRAAVPAGLTYPSGATPPVGADHLVKYYGLQIWENACSEASKT